MIKRHRIKADRINWNPLTDGDEDYIEYTIDGIEEVCSMAHPVGQISSKVTIFVMYSDDKGSHAPHIHVCMLDPNKKLKGKFIKHKKPYKNLFSITLRPDGEPYTRENIQFEKVWNKNDKVLDDVIEWLNSWKSKSRRNCDKAMEDYIDANGYGMQNPEAYKEWMRKVDNETAYSSDDKLISEVLAEI